VLPIIGGIHSTETRDSVACMTISQTT